MNFSANIPSTPINVDTILSAHYFKCNSFISGPIRGYDFLEFIYLEEGEAAINTSNGLHQLKQGDILFHDANIVHSIAPISKFPATILTTAFIPSSYTKHFLENKRFHIDSREEAFINKYILEVYNSYSSDIDSYHQPYMRTAIAAPFGSEQLLRLHLEMLIIHVIRKQFSILPESPEREKSVNEEELLHRIIAYMEANVNTRLTIDKICKDNLISHSKLQKLFKEKLNKSVIDYFLGKKIDVAKLLISENAWNFTQIAEHLGYSSVHFFSRQFKKITGVTPSEYSESVTPHF